MSFTKRIKKSEEAVYRFDKYLEDNGIDFSKTGYEDLTSSPSFMESIRDCNDGTSKRLRYFPDRTIVSKKCMLIEIKHGSSIEKDAYDNYTDLNNIGYNVGIVFYKDDDLLFCEISELTFNNALQWKKLSDKNIVMPIIDNVWHDPRSMNDHDLHIYKSIYPRGSTTSFAYIDFDNTKFKIL